MKNLRVFASLSETLMGKPTGVSALPHPRPQRLQIPALGTVRHHRMVRPRATAVENLQAPSVSVRQANHDVLEFIDGHQAGAGASEEQTTPRHERQRQLVEIVILGPALREAIARMDQLWRIEHH